MKGSTRAVGLSMDGGAIPEEAGFLNRLAHDLAPDSTTTGSSGISTAAGGAISGEVTTAATGSSLGGGGVGTEGCGGSAGSGAITTSS